MSKRKSEDYFKLTEEQDRELYKRQKGRCAISGEPLDDSYRPHHVVPVSHGGVRNAKTDAFVNDYQRNCVLVNDLDLEDDSRADGAHIEAHGFNFNGGPAVVHSECEYSHGTPNSPAHRAWAEPNNKFVVQELFRKEVDNTQAANDAVRDQQRMNRVDAGGVDGE